MKDFLLNNIHQQIQCLLSLNWYTWFNLFRLTLRISSRYCRPFKPSTLNRIDRMSWLLPRLESLKNRWPWLINQDWFKCYRASRISYKTLCLLWKLIWNRKYSSMMTWFFSRLRGTINWSFTIPLKQILKVSNLR